MQQKRNGSTGIRAAVFYAPAKNLQNLFLIDFQIPAPWFVSLVHIVQ